MAHRILMFLFALSVAACAPVERSQEGTPRGGCAENEIKVRGECVERDPKADEAS